MSDKELYRQFRDLILTDMAGYIDATFASKSEVERTRIFNEWRGRVLEEKIIDEVLQKMDSAIEQALNSPL